LALTSVAAKGVRVVALVPAGAAMGSLLRPVGGGIGLLALIIAALLLRAKTTQPDALPLDGAALPDPITRLAIPTRPSTAADELANTAVALELAAVGQQIGRYSAIRKLGSGGMAEVYLARATGEAGFEKLVALKVLNPRTAQ